MTAKHIRDALWRRNHAGVAQAGRRLVGDSESRGVGQVGQLAALGAKLLGGALEHQLTHLEEELEACRAERDRLQQDLRRTQAGGAELQATLDALAQKLTKGAMKRAGAVGGD